MITEVVIEHSKPRSNATETLVRSGNKSTIRGVGLLNLKPGYGFMPNGV